MAAGLSSRFGGEPKILCKVGPNNESIFEMNMIQITKYINPKKIHLVCNEKTCDKILSEVSRVCSKHNINAEISHNIQIKPSFRDKPWGTADALASTYKSITEPFILLNSDDLYGERTFELISTHCNISKNYIIGFKLGNTLMNGNKANRGFISFDKERNINKICEKLNIEKAYYNEEELDRQYVSVNLFILQPTISELINELLDDFKDDYRNQATEAMLPNFINKLLNDKHLDLEVLLTDSKWCGVTFKEDIPLVKSILIG
jgi:choline kinase